MDRETIARLDAINRSFYAAHAEDFLATRAAPWPGWSRLLPHLRQASTARETLRILDVGCGNARFGAWLEDHLDRPHVYAGLDRSLSLLARPASPIARALVDLVESGGELPCRTASCDAVVALALLHHVPSLALRQALVGELARVLHPGGILALSFWQFAAEERFERRMVSWQDWNRTGVATVDRAQIEEGDHLLAWGERGAGAETARYCHHTSREEAARLVASLPVSELEAFHADGRSGRLNFYLVLRRS